MKFKVIALVTILLILSTSLVFALNSDTYLTNAQRYIDNHCNRRLTDVVSLHCYLFYKLGEVQTEVDTNSDRITLLENTLPVPTQSPHQELITFDNEGNELGLYVDRNSFYYKPFERIVPLTDGHIAVPINDIWFSNTDCTGQAFGLFSINEYWRKVNEVVSGGIGKYYVVERSAGTLGAGVNSMQRYTGGVFVCSPISSGDRAWELTPVNLPFTDPISIPLQYKYQ